MAAGHYPTQGNEAQIADKYQACADVTIRARLRAKQYKTRSGQKPTDPEPTSSRPYSNQASALGANYCSLGKFLFQQSPLPHLCLVLPSFYPGLVKQGRNVPGSGLRELAKSVVTVVCLPTCYRAPTLAIREWPRVYQLVLP